MAVTTEIRLSLSTALSRALLADPLFPENPTIADYRAAIARVPQEEKAVAQEDPFSCMRVQSALAALAATSKAVAVSSHVLALEMTPIITNESPEQREAAIKRVVRTLQQQSQKNLAEFFSEGRWCLNAHPK